MASKTVSDVFLKLKVEGQQTLERLRGSFRSLEKTVGVTDRGIEQLRKGLKDYTGESNNSIKVLKGQIEALKELKDQATIGGRVFKSLTEDIKLYERQLKAAEQQANRTAKAVNGKQIEARFTKLGVPGLEQQLGLRRQALKDLTPLTEKYAGALGEVLQFETALTRLQERQSVTAARARTVTFTAARGGKGLFDLEGLVEYGNVFKELPRTTAGFGQRLKELRQDFVNLDVGSDQYLSTLREIAAVQREIARGERIQELAGRDEGLIGRQGVLESYIERRRGRRTRLTSRLGAEAEDYRARQDAARRAAAPVPTQVREISGLYQQIGDIGMARTRASIDAMGNSYKQVTRDIKAATAASNGSINSLQSQRAAWSTLRAGLRPSSRAFREVTKEIEKVDRQLAKLERRRGFSGRNLVAGVGGALSGSVFGGPEAAIGGLVGGLTFGPAGAAVGAAAGAQLSAVRQQAAAVAEFAGQLNLAKTTLAQASTGIKDYNRLLELARKVSSDYSVSLKPAISGLAQIATAARANNLSFEDTEKIFRGLIASNVAFGKSQEDLDAIIRATVQVLSKGKVSAEELSGQIGERLPGAVAKFAAANEMTLPQLTKAFKDGEVTIAQFVRFAAAQGEEFDGVAQLIAQGPEKAGVRLQIALEQAGENFGGFFLKVGSGFQDYLTNLVTFVNENQDKIKDVIVDVKIAAEQIVEIIQTLIEDIKETVGPIFTFIAENLNRGIGAVYSKVREGRELKAGGFSDAAARKSAETYARDLGFDPIFTPLGFQQAFREGFEVEKQQARIKGRSVVGADVQTDRQAIKESLFGFTPSSFGGKTTPPIAGTEELYGEGTGKTARDTSKAQADLLIKISSLRRQDLTVQADILEFELGIQRALEMQDTPNKARIEAARALDIFTKRQESWFKGIGKEAIKQGKLSEERNKLERDFNADLQDRQYQLGLITEDKYNQLVIDRERARLEEQLKGVPGAAGMVEAGVELKRREIDPTPFQEMKQNIAQLKQELEDLVNPVNQITGAANAIGTAFSQSFASVINGSATAKEALASFFKNIANYFLDMAAQIIAKMIQMAILNTIVGLLPGGGTPKGVGGGASGALAVGKDVPIAQMPAGMQFAKGGVFGSGVKRYAMGGIVKKPTMFAYADGGTGRFGLMGEQGAEAIMPLKRGPNGRLGVEASGGGTNVVVNVDASGSQVQGNQPDASQLGRAIGAAVQAELIKQKRPGGLLA